MARSNITDFLNNFNAAYGLSRKVSEGLELAKVANEKPEEREGFSKEDGDQLEAASKVINPETGQPYYDIKAKDGGYEIGLSEAERANGLLNGAESQPEPGLMRPTAKTDFLGNTYEGKLDDAKVKGLRARASADVVGKYDPERGLRQHALLDQQDRFKVVQGREDTTWKQSQDEFAAKEALKTATTAYTQAQTPEEKAAAKSGLMKLPGGLDMLRQLGKTEDDLYNVNRSILWRHTMPLAERGDIDGLIKAYSMYHDGYDARRGSNNAIEIVDEKTGDVVQTVSYKDNKDLTNLLFRSIFPEKAAEQDAKTAAEARVLQQKKELELFKAQANGRGPYGTGSTGRSSSKPPPDKIAQATSHIEKLIGNDDKAFAMSALSNARAMLDLNPAMPVEFVSDAALMAAKNPASITPKLNEKTLQWENVVSLHGKDITLNRNVPKDVADRLMPKAADDVFGSLMERNPDLAKGVLGDKQSADRYLSNLENAYATAIGKASGKGAADSGVWEKARAKAKEQSASEFSAYSRLFEKSKNAMNTKTMLTRPKNQGTPYTKLNLQDVADLSFGAMP